MKIFAYPKYLNEHGHLNENAIGIYVDEHLHHETSTLPNQVHKHLEECQECRLAVFDVYEMMPSKTGTAKEKESIVLEKDTAKKETRFNPQPPLSYLQWITGLLILCIPLVFLFWVKSSGQEFKTNPILNKFVEAQYRGDEITPVFPPIDATVSIPFYFKWTPATDSVIRLEVLNNKAVPVNKVPITGNSYYYEDSLSPGLYYWKLIGKDGVLLVGKFIIK